MPFMAGIITMDTLSWVSDHENTCKILRDIIMHPNAGAVLIVGLVCENNQPDKFMELLGDYDKDRIKLFSDTKG